MTWQQQEPGQWVLGDEIRGFVRHALAVVVHFPQGNTGNPEWKWSIPKPYSSGFANSLLEAIEACEEKLKP